MWDLIGQGKKAQGKAEVNDTLEYNVVISL